MKKPGKRQEYIRLLNMKAIIHALRLGGKTFIELEEIMGLSNAAIFKIVSSMSDLGVIKRSQLPSTTSGRKAEIITINPSYGYFAVILARTDVIRVTINNFVGDILYKKEYYTGYVIQQSVIYEVAEELKKNEIPLNHVIFTYSGKYDNKNERFIFAGKFINFYNINFPEMLSEKIGAPVIMKPDMTTVMQAELGKAQTPESFIFLYIDEGVGGGIVLNKKIFTGERGMAGEVSLFGLNPITADDFFPNKKSKIFSTELSFKSLSEKYCAANGKVYDNYETQKEELIAACYRKDKIAVKCLKEYVGVLGRFCWSLTELLDISHIIITGEFARLKESALAEFNKMFSSSPTKSNISVKFVEKSDRVYDGSVVIGLAAFEDNLIKN